MTKQVLLMAAAVLFGSFFCPRTDAQTPRASVSASEVNGTFLHKFAGKFKGSASEIKILALGKGKLIVAFELVHPFTDGMGELSANLGYASGTASISGDTAIFKSNESGKCTITIKFVRPGMILVDEEGGSNCGFGHNVTAAGRYVRSSSRKPTFDSEH